jgi:hypothetical protein
MLESKSNRHRLTKRSPLRSSGRGPDEQVHRDRPADGCQLGAKFMARIGQYNIGRSSVNSIRWVYVESIRRRSSQRDAFGISADPLAGNNILEREIGMKIYMQILPMLICASSLMAQHQCSHLPFEFLGSISYNNSTVGVAASQSYVMSQNLNTQNLMFRPSIGYFLNDEIELLFDVQYNLLYERNNYGNELFKWWSHRLGLSIGASYNYPINQIIIPFLGTRIGTSWSRMHSESGVPDDYGWGKPEISFPDLFIGTRFFVSKDWAVTVSIEYSKIVPYSNFPIYWDKNESTSVNFGFSVFL